MNYYWLAAIIILLIVIIALVREAKDFFSACLTLHIGAIDYIKIDLNSPNGREEWNDLVLAKFRQRYLELRWQIERELAKLTSTGRNTKEQREYATKVGGDMESAEAYWFNIHIDPKTKKQTINIKLGSPDGEVICYTLDDDMNSVRELIKACHALDKIMFYNTTKEHKADS